MFNPPAATMPPPQTYVVGFSDPPGTLSPPYPRTVFIQTITPAGRWGIKYRPSTTGVWVDHGEFTTTFACFTVNGAQGVTVDTQIYPVGTGVLSPMNTYTWTFT